MANSPKAQSLYDASTDRLAQKYGLSKAQLAQTIGLSPETLQKSARSNAQKTQARLREMVGDSCARHGLGRRVGSGAGLVSRRTDPGFRRPHRGIAGQDRPGRFVARLSRFRGGRRLCVRFAGLAYRAHDPRWSFTPLSGAGAALYGGRFNPKGVPALYLSLDPITAMKEAAQGFAHKFEPYVLCTYEVDCEPIVDARTEPSRREAGIELAEMASPWFADAREHREPSSWALSRRLIARGRGRASRAKFRRGGERKRHQPRALAVGTQPADPGGRVRSERTPAKKSTLLDLRPKAPVCLQARLSTYGSLRKAIAPRKRALCGDTREPTRMDTVNDPMRPFRLGANPGAAQGQEALVPRQRQYRLGDGAWGHRRPGRRSRREDERRAGEPRHRRR